MSIYRALNPLPSNMFIEPGQGGHIKRLENSFKNAKYEQDDLLVMYDNKFVRDMIGSRIVSTILNYKAANSVPYIEQSKSVHEEVGLVTQRNLAIVLKIRSKLTAFLFGILEDSDLPPIIGTEIREQYPECFMDFNITDDKQVYVTSLKVLKRRAKEKDFIQSFFAKSPTVYEDLKRLHAKTGHGSFVRLKTALTVAKKWQPGFDGSLTQIIKRCKLCTHHADIINTEVDRFNDVVQV
jgi:hypothetical protein